MFKNMFTIAWRSAIRHKQFSILNILGLSIGITASLLIGLYVINELSYDNFHEKGDRIYRVNQPMIWGDWNEPFASTGPNLGLALRTDIPEFEEVTRVHSPGSHVVSYQPINGTPISFREEQVYIAEDNFFDIFTFTAIKGDLKNALNDPLSLVITEETAKKYFGDEDPIGKILKLEQGGNSGPFTVTAVLNNLPTNSHIQFDLLASMSSFSHIKNREHQWIWTTFVTYGLVQPGTNIQALEKKIQAIPPKWAVTEIQNVFGQTYDEYMQGKTWNLYLQPLNKVYIHTHSSGNRIGPSGNFDYVKIFMAVGCLILLLSSINFMNLSTARSANRAKEVGIRKVLGSEKMSLVRQFIFESIMFVLLSTLIAVVIAEMSLGAFNAIIGTNISLYTQLMNWPFTTSLLGFIIFLGLAAGSYPAFFLSSFKPMDVLKGKLGAGFKGKPLRNALVVLQFTISVALIICTFFVQRQLNYASNLNLGFDKRNILQVHNMELLGKENRQTLENLLNSNPAIEEVGVSDLVPPNVYNEDKYKVFRPESETTTLNRLRVDASYMDLLDLKFMAGRSFDESRGTDQYKVILNAAAVNALGWNSKDSGSIIGEHITFPNSEEALFEVIGVVEDFNYNSIRFEINPLMIIHDDNDKMWESGDYHISIRLNNSIVNSTTQLETIIEQVESGIMELNAGIPFEYSFMDQDFEANFRSEQQMGKILNVFTLMALSIACLGLFGLAAFSAEQRKKELGVRKVLGASIYRLVYLFTSEFTILIFVSLVIATPLAYFLVQQWLADYAYKAPMDFSVFLIAGLGSLIIAWLTISFQSVRAAKQNPADVLRDE